MKRILLFVAIASVFTLASCTKDRTCTCTDADGNKYVTVYRKVTKDDMRVAGCVTTTTTTTSSGGVSSTPDTFTCVISK